VADVQSHATETKSATAAALAHAEQTSADISATREAGVAAAAEAKTK